MSTMSVKCAGQFMSAAVEALPDFPELESLLSHQSIQDPPGKGGGLTDTLCSDATMDVRDTLLRTLATGARLG